MALGISIGIGVSTIAAAAGAGGVAPEPPAAYDPLSLFAASEVGMLYDPQRIETLWQDTAGTIPVTADGQLVARIDDRSGNGRHLTQGTAANQYKYRTDGTLKWLDSEGRACPYQTAHPLTGPLTYGFGAEITQSAGAGELFSTGPNSGTDSSSVYVGWSTSTGEVRMVDRGASTATTRGITGGAGRHMGVVARLVGSGSNNYLDYGRAPLVDATARLLTGTTSGTGFRMGPTLAKQVRFYGLFVIQRLITDAERDYVAAYYASLGRLENLYMWMGDAQ